MDQAQLAGLAGRVKQLTEPEKRAFVAHARKAGLTTYELQSLLAGNTQNLTPVALKAAAEFIENLKRNGRTFSDGGIPLDTFSTLLLRRQRLAENLEDLEREIFTERLRERARRIVHFGQREQQSFCNYAAAIGLGVDEVDKVLAGRVERCSTEGLRAASDWLDAVERKGLVARA